MNVTLVATTKDSNRRATAAGSSPSARLSPRAFVAKFESKDFQITTKMRQPDRRPSREVAFIADSIGQVVQPAKPGGEDAWSGIASDAISRVRYLRQLNNFGLEISLREKKSSIPLHLHAV